MALHEDVLRLNPPVDLGFAHNDSTAYGADLAAKGAVAGKKMKFVGADGLPNDNAAWVRKGSPNATFVYPTPGGDSLCLALKIPGGEKACSREGGRISPQRRLCGEAARLLVLSGAFYRPYPGLGGNPPRASKTKKQLIARLK